MNNETIKATFNKMLDLVIEEKADQIERLNCKSEIVQAKTFYTDELLESLAEEENSIIDLNEYLQNTAHDYLNATLEEIEKEN